MSGIRFGGLISGLDTDSVVKALTMNQQAKIDNIKKENQISVWKQNDYRTVISKLNDFRTKYFSNSNPLSNLLSSTAINGYTSKVTNSLGALSGAVDASASGTIRNALNTLKVDSIAQKEQWSSGTVSEMKGSLFNAGDIANLNTEIAAAALDGKTLKITGNLDGVLKTIELNNTPYANMGALATDLQAKFNSVYGAGNVTVSFTPPGPVTDKQLTFTAAAGHKFGIGDAAGAPPTIRHLGFSEVSYTSLQTGKALKDANFVNALTFVPDGLGNNVASFKINGQTFTVKDTDSVQSVLDRVSNDANAGVRMYYSDLSNSVIMESKNTGVASSIKFEDVSGSFFGSIMGGANNTVAASAGKRTQAASDARFTLNGITTSRATNTFDAEGITYTLKQVTNGETLNVSMAPDTSKTKELLLNFAKDYNELIKFINDKTREERNKTYSPLTADQKSAMTESEIKLWEEEAKKGHLRNDDILTNLLANFNNVVFGSRTSTGGNAFGLGFGNTSSYTDGGQIAVDTTQLDKILSMSPEEVEKLFNDPTNGIATKLNKMIGLFAGTKLEETGLLTKRAGVAGGFSDYFNSISETIRTRNIRIEEMLVSLNKRQNVLYSQYAKLESTMSKMNGQLNSMLSKLG